MSVSIGYKQLAEKQGYASLQISFTHTPSEILLSQFVNALNQNQHLPYTVSYQQLLQLPYIQIAYTLRGGFVAGCSIKNCDGQLAEIGFMLVEKRYRGLGIAEYMTQCRINHAQQLGVQMLYAKIRGNNLKSINNLQKAGFKSAGRFLSQKDSYSSITWFYLPLQAMSKHKCYQRLRSKLTKLVPVIG